VAGVRAVLVSHVRPPPFLFQHPGRLTALLCWGNLRGNAGHNSEKEIVNHCMALKGCSAHVLVR